MPASQMRVRVAQVLQDEGYLARLPSDAGQAVELEIDLKYGQTASTIHRSIERVCSPAPRLPGCEELPRSAGAWASTSSRPPGA